MNRELLRLVKREGARFVRAAFGTLRVIRNGIAPKTAFGAFRLATHPFTAGNDHAPGLTYREALRVVIRAKQEDVDTFDLWLIFDGYVCEDLDEAVSKLREMNAIYDSPIGRN